MLIRSANENESRALGEVEVLGIQLKLLWFTGKCDFLKENLNPYACFKGAVAEVNSLIVISDRLRFTAVFNDKSKLPDNFAPKTYNHNGSSIKSSLNSKTARCS